MPRALYRDVMQENYETVTLAMGARSPGLQGKKEPSGE
uniref:KRAB domain-containing protein n=1 Tax=Chrysemys picta bellii TaxID=8478 RepID=A0A8C3H6K6_CHRPI